MHYITKAFGVLSRLSDNYIGIYIISAIVMGVFYGAITLIINKNKGYKGGFQWGFFLGILGVIIVAVRSSRPDAKGVIEVEAGKALKENEIEDIIDRMEAQSRQQKLSEYEELLKKGKITEAEYRQRIDSL